MVQAQSLCVGVAAPAHGQFCSLEGRYRCLNDPEAVCFDATSNEPAPQPKPEPELRPVPAGAEPARPVAKPAHIGTAASSAVAADPLHEMPNAERNQAIVYETDMSPEQRQRALAIENWVMIGPAE